MFLVYDACELQVSTVKRLMQKLQPMFQAVVQVEVSSSQVNISSSLFLYQATVNTKMLL